MRRGDWRLCRSPATGSYTSEDAHRRGKLTAGQGSARAGPDAPTSAVAITQESGQTRNASQVTLDGA